MRWRLRSLHARMLALSGVATLLALAVAGWIIAGVLERFVTAGLDQRLDAEVALLASTVDADGRVDRTRLEQRLGAFDAGPGWRWRIVSPGGTIGSADFPRFDERPPGPPPEVGEPRPQPSVERPRPLDGREHGFRIHARRLTIATRRGPVELTAAAPRDVVARPIRGALAPLLAALAVLAGLLGLAAIIQLRVGLRPLRALRDQVAAIRGGTRQTVDEDQPSELRPLAAELNALATENATTLATARLSAANLAHALKTPVATLALDLRDDPFRAAQVARIGATIRHHLARARIEAADRRATTLLAPALADLVAAVRRIQADKRLSFDLAVPDDLAVGVDPQDLDELLGNLLDNAARHAARLIRVGAALDESDARRLRIEIADDGPGIPAAERARVARPGVRLDERGDGHGFGLSIASELAALYGGSLELHDAAIGGLLVVVELSASPRV